MDSNKPTHSQRKKGIVTIIDAPEIILSADDNAGDVLLKFYYAIGWNGDDILDPYKVRTTETVYNNLYNLMLEKCPDSISVGVVMVNKAPGVDDDIPPNKVYLLEGWTKPPELPKDGEAC